MKAAIPLWLPFYRDPEFDPNLKSQLLKISATTIERFLNRGRKIIKGLSLTRRSKFFRYKIPLTNTSDKIINVDHVAADTVAHCGDDMSGTFAWSLTVTDRLTGWTENRATPGKQAKTEARRFEKLILFSCLMAVFPKDEMLNSLVPEKSDISRRSAAQNNAKRNLLFAEVPLRVQK